MRPDELDTAQPVVQLVKVSKQQNDSIETAARVLGINVARYKLTAFVLSAVYASIAGSYFALFDGFVTPDTSSFLRSIEFVVMAVLGGLGSIFGSIVGAAILVLLPQFLTVFHDYEQIVLGAIMIAFQPSRDR